MTPIEIDSSSIVPIEYSHMHDVNIVFKKYRENFDYGLTVNQYYFNEDPKDKKTNFNTQYTLTNTYPLSSILELNTPFTTQAVSSFSTTLQSDDDGNVGDGEGAYLKTNFTNLDLVSSGFVATSQFTNITGDNGTQVGNLSSEFFFTFNISSVPGLANHANLSDAKKYEDRVSISQQYKPPGENNRTVTFYLSAPTVNYNTTALWTSAGPSYFRYYLDNDRIAIHAGEKLGSSYGALLRSSVAGEPWYWTNVSTTWTTNIGVLSSSFFNINRNILTDGFKNIPNNYTKYLSSYNTDKVDLDTSTIVSHISNNYFVFSNNYNFSKVDNKIDAHADLFPLKNQATLHEYYAENNHFNAEPGYLNRVYEKINAGTNQIGGYDKIGLSYNIGTYDIIFKPNKLTYFTTPNSMAPYTVLNIADSKIHNLGAVPGDNPLMSDKVFKRRETVKNNTFSDDTNPIYLCSWLSGSNTGDKRWVDRYYNPLVTDFTKALSGTSYYSVVTAAGAETTETFDVSSSLTFEPNNDYIYYHIGSNDYANLFDAYNTIYNGASSIEYLNYKGVPITPLSAKNDAELTLNGENFGKFNTNIVGDFSVGFWLHTKDYTLPVCHKLVGNIFDEGFGIFNTDLVTPNIILPTINPRTGVGSKMLFLNNDFEVYDEVILKEGQSEIDILGIGRKDNFSEFYVLGANNIIYVYNTNNNLTSKIENLKNSSLVIDDFEVSEDRLQVLFNPISARNIFTYDINNNTVIGTTTSPYTNTPGQKGKISYRNCETVTFSADNVNGYGNEIAFDSNDTPFIMKQFTPTIEGADVNYLQKGVRTDTNEIIQSGLGIKSRVNGVVIDDEDQLVVLHDNNIISLLDNDRKLIRTREICNLNNASIQQSYMDLIYDFEDGVYKKYILLLQEFLNETRLTKFDFNLKIQKHKVLKKVDVLPLNLTKTITSYYYLKKIGANKSRFKVLLKTNPKYSTTGKLHTKKFTIDFDVTQLNPGYNHFFVNVSLRLGYMCLYVNGKFFKKVGFNAGKYALDNVLGTGCYIGAVSTPYYLTLANKLLQPKKYFVENCKIKGFKLYNKTMSYFDILAHYNYHLDDKDVIWSYPIGQRTYIDTIDKLMKFNFPEKISNNYQVEIKNTGITNTALNNKLKIRLEKELQKITPYFDEIKDIVIS